jgi:ADP-ribosylglycohydrolase/protein-tyrosine phosphatase
MTFCPGKKQRNSISGHWDRDLGADLQVIHDFGAAALVTLMETSELEGVEVTPKALASTTGKMDIEWHHLPIEDVNVPDEDFDELWEYSGARLRMHLAKGRRVVVHCRGGLGRTGMVAARLLVELGHKPEKAIDEVRRARRGAIETAKQEQYVKQCQPVAGVVPGPSRQERRVACLLGGAVGDGFGYVVEFQKLAQIRAKYGPQGLQSPQLKAGKLVVSDDTQMTLFTLEGLLRGLGKPPSDETLVSEIRDAYLDWLHTQGGGSRSRRLVGKLASDPALRTTRAPGNTCLSSLANGGRGSIGSPINDSKGCGGVMRVAPVGLVAGQQTPEDAFRLAAEAAALTHGHPSGYLSAGMLAAIVRLLVDGVGLRQAYAQSAAILRKWKSHEETLRVVQQALDLAGTTDGDPATTIHRIGGGWVGEEALAMGLFAAISAQTYCDAIQVAANHDGDSDSTASIVGQLWGVWKGLDGIPHDWITALDVFRPLVRLTAEMGQLLLRDGPERFSTTFKRPSGST